MDSVRNTTIYTCVSFGGYLYKQIKTQTSNHSISQVGCLITGQRYVDGGMRADGNVCAEKASERDDETRGKE